MIMNVANQRRPRDSLLCMTFDSLFKSANFATFYARLGLGSEKYEGHRLRVFIDWPAEAHGDYFRFCQHL